MSIGGAGHSCSPRLLSAAVCLEYRLFRNCLLMFHGYSADPQQANYRCEDNLELFYLFSKILHILRREIMLASAYVHRYSFRRQHYITSLARLLINQEIGAHERRFHSLVHWSFRCWQVDSSESARPGVASARPSRRSA